MKSARHFTGIRVEIPAMVHSTSSIYHLCARHSRSCLSKSFLDLGVGRQCPVDLGCRVSDHGRRTESSSGRRVGEL